MQCNDKKACLHTFLSNPFTLTSYFILAPLRLFPTRFRLTFHFTRLSNQLGMHFELNSVLMPKMRKIFWHIASIHLVDILSYYQVSFLLPFFLSHLYKQVLNSASSFFLSVLAHFSGTRDIFFGFFTGLGLSSFWTNFKPTCFVLSFVFSTSLTHVDDSPGFHSCALTSSISLSLEDILYTIIVQEASNSHYLQGSHCVFTSRDVLQRKLLAIATNLSVIVFAVGHRGQHLPAGRPLLHKGKRTFAFSAELQGPVSFVIKVYS